MVIKWVGKTVFTPCVVTMLCSEHNRRIKEQTRLFIMMVVTIHGTG